MKILSIDVGTRNLALCHLKNDKTILHWDVDGIPPQTSKGIFPALRDHLNERDWVLDTDLVLIEKQPGRNKRMKAVENFLHAYFIIHEKETIIYDARFKVPDVVGSGKALYNKRKKVAVERCGEFLQSDNNNIEWRPVFEKSKKKDDLADTVLQAISYIDRKPTTIKSKKEKKKVHSRKPTDNQKRTKYSQSNLLWLYKTDGQEKFIKTKRYMKDLSRYWSTIEEMMDEIK